VFPGKPEVGGESLLWDGPNQGQKGGGPVKEGKKVSSCTTGEKALRGSASHPNRH